MKKLLNKKGFTLMEMLIVVAIIVILVAISIPTFTSQLDNAKKATDDANLRAAKGIANTREMMEGWSDILGENVEDDTLYYNIETGEFQTTEITTGYGQSSDYKGEVIIVEIEDGSMKTGFPKWSGDVTPEG